MNLWDSPKLKGTVVDPKGASVEGVKISDVSLTRKTSKMISKTDSQGNFELIPGNEKIHPIAPGCYGSRKGHFVFEKDLYESAIVPYNITCGGGDMPEMSDAKVVLKPKQRSE